MKLIGVIGAGECDPGVAQQAYEVGRLIAHEKCILVTGGRTGVMEAASKGASESGGLVVGILPGKSINEANRYVAIPIITGIGEARNVIIARSAHGLIAMRGEYGTISEIAFGLKFEKPVVSLGNQFIDPKIYRAKSPADAVRAILDRIR